MSDKAALIGNDIDDFAGSYTRSRRDRSVLGANDPINIQPPPDDDDNDNEQDEFIRPRRNRSVLSQKDKEDDDDEQEQEPEIEESLTVPTRSRRDRSVLNVEETLNKENEDIVFEGMLERKTNQKVLGKHLWETRYFKLSTHSISIYINDKVFNTESIIKLSSIISINRNTKNDGADLKDNRFDIHLKDETVNLRTENDVVCKQWIHFISQQRKQHKKSIRTGLEDVYSSRYRSKGTIEYEPSMSLSVSTKHKSVKKEKINRFKRRKTSRSEIQRKAVSIHDDDDKKDDEEEEEDETEKLKKSEEESSKNLISKPAEFEGFLLRKIGHKNDKIGEKIYFRLTNDQLEFSKIEQTLDQNDEKALNAMHSDNILGSISIEHIKSVQMTTTNDEDEFVLVFNDHNPNSDWILKTIKSDKGNAQKWVDVLQRAQTEAAQIVKIINNTKVESVVKEEEDEDGDEDEDDSESDSESFGKRKKKKKKKIGGSIKALQKMINDETIEELETARNNELDSKHLVNGFEINSLENEDENEQMLKSAQNSQACACCLVM